MESILKSEDISACHDHCVQWMEETWPIYSKVMCCNSVGHKTSKVVKKAFDSLNSAIKISDTFEEIDGASTNNICSLPKGHEGNCSSSYYKNIFTSNGITNKIDWLFTTPGNNDFVFKNRHSRLFPIRLSDKQEKKIRNKDVKLKCAIPLKDASTPEMIASAVLDYLTLIFNVKGIEAYLNDKSMHYKIINPMILEHKKVLTEFYAEYDRQLFNSDGYSVCPVTGRALEVADFLLKLDDPLGIQLGHVQPRDCQQYTIRGFNVLMMSRDGNRIIGDYNFIQNEWIEKIEGILNFHKLKV